MTREFRILSERWVLILVPITAAAALLNLIRLLGSFENQQDWFNGSLVLFWFVMLASTTFTAWRQLQKRHTIRLEEDGVITLVRDSGKKNRLPERITVVREDQVEFHVFSKKNSLSIPKKRMHPDLRKILSDRVNEG